MIIAPLITILISLISLDSLNAQIFLPKSSLFCQGLVDYELATYSDYDLTFDYLNSVDSNLYRIFNGIEPYRAALPLQVDFLWKYFCALAYPKLDAEKNGNENSSCFSFLFFFIINSNKGMCFNMQ